MIEEIRNIISDYITEFSDIDDWKSIRQTYLYASYVTFLVIAINELEEKLDDIEQSAINNKLEDCTVLKYLFGLPDIKKLIKKVTAAVKKTGGGDASVLYQQYLSVDYVKEHNQITFCGGKNSRDVLGAYYTPDNFAAEVVKKSMDDYLKYNKDNHAEIRVIDLSCGSGTFLLATYYYCIKKNIKVILYGIDVDPIAIMITRARLCRCCNDKNVLFNIKLGNPLLEKEKNIDALEMFKVASLGRFYNAKLGIDILDKFDVVVGNPPWEKIRFEEKKFLQHYVSNENIESKINRQNLLLSVSQKNREFFESNLVDYELVKKRLKNNKAFKNTNAGELNTYALFTELSFNLLEKKGISGLIVKSSLLKLQVYKEFMKYVAKNQYLYEVYMFNNKNKIFNIDSREEFAVIFLRAYKNNIMNIVLDLNDYNKFYDREKIVLPYHIIELINPNTGMLPNIKNNQELRFLINVYTANKVFGEIYHDCKFGRLVHLTSHSKYISKVSRTGNLPIYEGKFIELYTSKYATFDKMTELEKYKNKASARLIEDIEGEEYPEARYYIDDNIWKCISKNFKKENIIAWRSLTSATNRRTMLATMLPLVPTCQSIQMLQIDDINKMMHILALFNSVVFDYIVRLKMVGLDLTQTIVKQIPVPDETSFARRIIFDEIDASISEHIISRLRVLYKNDNRISHIFKEIDYYKISDNRERKQLISEIDVLISILYGMKKEELLKIVKEMNKFYTKEEAEKWF